MSRATMILGSTLSIALNGCLPPATKTSTPPPASTRTVRTAQRPPVAEISWDTDRDRVFAEFLRDKAGVMIRKAAVGIEQRAVTCTLSWTSRSLRTIPFP